jgi:hypothetical protein
MSRNAHPAPLGLNNNGNTSNAINHGKANNGKANNKRRAFRVSFCNDEIYDLLVASL